MKANLLIPTGIALLAIFGCNLLAPATPSSDLLATLQASTPPSPLEQTQAADFSTPLAGTPQSVPTPVPGSSSGGPAGKIVWTCQLFKVQAMNQVCIMNADGSGFRRLTTDDGLEADVVADFVVSLVLDGLRPR